eukprot:5690602-Heterocapsa_arctica.AAC.1
MALLYGDAARGILPVGLVSRSLLAPRPSPPCSTRHRSIAIMQLHVSASRLRLIAHACPDPLDHALSKRAWEALCRDYRQRCRATMPALAFLELGVSVTHEEALRLLGQPGAPSCTPALGPVSFLDSMD